MFRVLAALGLIGTVLAAPVNIKVSSSGKAYASANLLSALKEEVSSAAAQEIDFFLRELGQKTSFLKTPVVAENIRNGLYLSESLRSPVQTVVNVVEREPTHAIQQRAAVDGLEAKTRALEKKFRLDLARLRAGH